MHVDPWWLAYPVLGAFVGFFAGLLGIGGGMMSVPILAMLFDMQRMPHEHLLHLALGTAFASIVFTSLSSVRAHHGHDAVRWDVVKGIAPGLVLGTFAGSALASIVPTRVLAWLVVAFIGYTALQMFRNTRPKPTRELPGPLGLTAVGAVIGGVCGLVAAGGGFLTIPYMVWCNVPIHQAIGTSAALGFPIALAGALGYVVFGWSKSGLPSPTLGYVFLPALAGVVLVSILFAPLGARIAHRTEGARLKRVFGVVMVALALKVASRSPDPPPRAASPGPARARQPCFAWGRNERPRA
jgi:uncharacterized membrane protein YfcA